MRLLGLLLTIAMLAPSSSVPHQGTLPDDPYNIQTIKLLVESNQGKPGVIFGFESKVNGQMGDAISIALLKAYTEEELSKPELVRAYLPIIRTAFSSPGYVIHKADLEPRVTLFFLHFLDHTLSDVKLLKQVKELETDLSKNLPIPARPSN